MQTEKESPIFELLADEGTGEKYFQFSILKEEKNHIPLRNVVRSYCPGFPPNRRISPAKIYLSLGKFRGLKWMLDQYNKQTMIPLEKEGVDSYQKYIRHHTIQVFSTFGFQTQDIKEPVYVDGLAELVKAIEEYFATDIKNCHEMIRQGIITHDTLFELFIPGTTVLGNTSVSGATCGFHVLQCYYNEHRSLFGMEKSFHLEIEYIASVGSSFAVIQFEEVFPNWSGAKTRPISELPYRPTTPDILNKLMLRGEKYVKYCCGGSKFVHYDGGSLYLHVSQKKTTVSLLSSNLNNGGRIILDNERGNQLGHYASQGSDESTNALLLITNRLRRQTIDKNQSSATDTCMTFSNSIPKEFLTNTWPAIVGYSFTAKGWGHVLVDGLNDIVFNDNAFNELVLDPERKKLIKALTKFSGTAFEDIIAGKSGGSIFLLHGPPGVGKTLTAEAISEILHKPIYYVTMGELGTTPEDMENRLGEILNLCECWDALVLIDEADVFLEKRTTSDIIRNAMVCVMLRLMEYHQGILFLTTNRVKHFDPAFESRVTVALRYDNLTEDSRKQIWINLIKKVKIDVAGNIDYGKLSKIVMNGRQIKNAIRLSVALAENEKSPLNQKILDQTIEIAERGKHEMNETSDF